ncbi:MAG: DUF1223 domain-containing protein [Silvibacterium sp.]
MMVARQSIFLIYLLLGLTINCTSYAQSHTAAGPAQSGAVLVELFTSEGCSSCPPADELLRQINGGETAAGQLIVGLSEHVSYWNNLGWRDPFSADVYTQRQENYGAHFGLSGVYTPQIVVNGREQLVGNDRGALEAAFATEAQRKHIELRISSVKVTEKDVTFSYSAMDLPPNGSIQLVAVLVDDTDRSNVARGENSGRQLTHAFVARALARLGPLGETNQRTMSLPLPPSFHVSSGTGHHLVLFAQQDRTGAILGTDTKPI